MASLSKWLIKGWTELHIAADSGDLARVQKAVQKAPNDVNRTNKEGRTALHLAAANGFDAVVGELLDRQAKATKQDEAGRTALHLAAAAGRPRCVAALLGHRNRDPPAEKARLVVLRDAEGRDALMAAVVEGQLETLEELLKAAGADARHCVDSSQCGLLIVAVRCGYTHMLPALLGACDGPDAQRDPSTGGTALHLAAGAGNLHILNCLLAAGASTTTKDNAGRTASDVALAAGQHAALRVLRDHSALPRSSPSVTSAASASSASEGLGLGLGPGGVRTPLFPASLSVASEQVPPPQARLQIPEQAPPPVYYPTPPSGAGIYF